MNPTLKKMSLDQYNHIVVLNKPDYVDLFDEIETKQTLSDQQDCIIVFIESLEEMKKMIYEVNEKQNLLDKGYLYFAYPKLGNKLDKPAIHRDDIFPYLNLDFGGDGFVDGTNLKFSRMVKFDDNYTVVGLRCFMKKPKPTKEVSGRVGDYEHHIPEIKNELKKDKVVLDYFESLSPYKQRDWARHIFSAQKEETRQKRWEKLYGEAKAN